MKKEELRNVDGSDSLHPNRSGDVVVVLKPPYQFDAATFGKTIAFSQFFGQHGYLPETVDLASGVNMHAAFVAAARTPSATRDRRGRPRDRSGADHRGAAQHPRPAECARADLYNLLLTPGQFKQATVLTHDDFHGQVDPLYRSGRHVEQPYVSIGGAAYLKPWFDVYRVEAVLRQPSLTMFTGGDFGRCEPAHLKLLW